jgi:addiction module HigA family antidote
MKDPPHIGGFIRREIIEPLELSVTDAARALGVTRQTLNNLLNEESGLSAEMALESRRRLVPGWTISCGCSWNMKWRKLASGKAQ